MALRRSNCRFVFVKEKRGHRPRLQFRGAPTPNAKHQESGTMRPYEATSFMDFGFNVVGWRVGVRTGDGVSDLAEVGYTSPADGRSYGLCHRTKLRTQSNHRFPVDEIGRAHV